MAINLDLSFAALVPRMHQDLSKNRLYSFNFGVYGTSCPPALAGSPQAAFAVAFATWPQPRPGTRVAKTPFF